MIKTTLVVSSHGNAGIFIGRQERRLKARHIAPLATHAGFQDMLGIGYVPQVLGRLAQFNGGVDTTTQINYMQGHVLEIAIAALLFMVFSTVRI